MDRAARETQRSMARIESSIKGAQRGFALFTRGLGALSAGLGVGLGLGAIVRATAEAEKSFALLENAVANNEGAAGKTADQLARMATELQHVSTFSDEAIQDAQGLLLTFKSITGVNFDRATQSVLDLATRLGKDLPSAALLVGKALEDPIKGMTQLARAGVVLSPVQQRLVKDFVDTGRAAQAQDVILGELEDTYQGAALAARDTFGGALEGLKNDFDNLLEAKGGVPGATAAINAFSKTLQDPGIKRGIDVIITALLTLGSTAVKAFAGAADGVLTITDHIKTLVEVATRGVALRVDLNAEEINQLLTELEARLELTKRTSRILIPTKIEKLEIAELERQIAHYKALKIEIPVEFKSLGATLGRPEPQAPVGLSEEQFKDLDRLLEASKDTKEKVQEQIDLLNQGLKAGVFAGIEGLKQYAKAYDYLRAQLEKPPKKTGLSEAQQAQKSILGLITSMEQQIAVTGETEEATIRYRIAFGDLADDFEKAGPKFRQRAEDLIAAARAMDEFKASEELDKANEQIAQQVVELQAARIGQEQGAAAAYAYLAAHGELAKTLDLATDSQEEYNAALKRGQDAAAQLEFEQAVTSIQALVTATTDASSAIIATAIAEEQGAVAAIRYRIAHGDLKQMFEELGPAAEEWQRKLEAAAAAQEVLTQRQKEDAASEAIIPSRVKATKEYDDALAGLNRRLQEGEITQREYAAGVKIAEKNLKEATKAVDEMSVFAEQAARNLQDALADFLFDPFEDGLEGMLKSFSDTLRRMAAEVVAAQLADYFNFEDWFKVGAGGKLGDIFGGGGGGGGGVPPGMTPGINPYEPYPTIGGMGAGPVQTGLGGFDPRQVALPDLAGAGSEAAAGTAIATALTTAGTTVATALTTAGTTAATALTTAGTTGATALSTAGTAVASAITAAGSAAAAAIAAAGAGSAAASGLSEIAITAVRMEKGGYLAPGKVALVGESTSRQAAPELLMAGKPSPTAALQALHGLRLTAAPQGPRIAGASLTGREAPELIRAGPAGITVVPLRERLERERFQQVLTRHDGDSVRLERTHATTATEKQFREWLKERERERHYFTTHYVGKFEKGGYIPPGQLGTVGDSATSRPAPEVLIGGRVDARERSAIVAAAMPLSVARPPSPGRPVMVGESRDGREHPQIAFGGTAGVTVVPLKESHRSKYVERLIDRVLPAPQVTVDARSAPVVRLDRERFAGFFAQGGYIPPNRFGVVGEGASREMLLAGQVGGPQAAKAPTVTHNQFVFPGFTGQVSRQTEMQLTAAAARGARQADRHNN